MNQLIHCAGSVTDWALMLSIETLLNALLAD